MSKWMLICSIDNDIKEPEYFNSEHEAYIKMACEMATVLECPIEEITMLACGGKTYIYEYGHISSDEAWCEYYGVMYTWRIFELEFAG